MPGIADFHGLDVEAFDQLGIDSFDEASESMRPARRDKRLSGFGGLHVAFERGQQVDLGACFELLLPVQI